jgi:hypothetical protein
VSPMIRPLLVPPALILALALGLAPGAAAGDDGPVRDPVNDCGVNALYLLLRELGASASLAELRRALPDPSPDGLSMAELQAGAGRLGYRLRGERFDPAEGPLDRPAIAWLNSEHGGHFVALRPVGETGTMAMVLDFPRPVRVEDYDRLASSPSWTGRILVPERWWERPRFRMMALGLSAGLLAAAILRIRPRLRRQS